MFEETERFTVLRFGYEHTLQELAQYRHLVEVKKVLDNISSSPDFILISNKKNKDNKLEVFTVEVKYRSSQNPKEIKEIAEKILKIWNPSSLFLATLNGFFFSSCSSVVKNEGQVSRLSDKWVSERLREKYFELLRDFEKSHNH